jgi:hypothetical protein
MQRRGWALRRRAFAPADSGRQWARRGFFEPGELPVVVEFFVDAAMADQLLKLIAEADLKLFYARLPAETGVTL